MVVVPPTTPVQTKYPSQRLEQPLPTPEFQRLKLARVMPAAEAMLAQMSPSATIWKDLQLETIPAWVGMGVLIPLPAVIAVVAMVDDEVVDVTRMVEVVVALEAPPKFTWTQ